MKKLPFFALLATAILTLYACGGDDEPEQGEYGQVVASGQEGIFTWELTDRGILVIAGEGEMPGSEVGTWDRYKQLHIEEIVIREGVTSIGRYSFTGTTRFNNITLPNSLTSIGDNAFSDCTGLTEIAIPNSVTSIGDGTFAGCIGLTEITLPNSVTSIRNFTFSGCTSLTSVTIGSGVGSIGYNAFSECYNLTHVTILATEFPFSHNVDSNFPASDDTLYVPRGTVEAYKNSDWGQVFTQIVEQS